MTQLAAWLPSLIAIHALVACWLFGARWRQRNGAARTLTMFSHTRQSSQISQQDSPGNASGAVILSWHNLQKTVLHASGSVIRHGRGRKVSSTERVLLAAVSGFIRAGDLHGLVGPSGAGKSTLLELLAGSYQQDRSVIISGTVISQSVDPCSLIVNAQDKQQHSLICARPAGSKIVDSGQGCSNSEHTPTGKPNASDAGLDDVSHTSPSTTSICYIPQQDLLLPTLTTYETLCFFDSLAVINDKHQVLPPRLHAACDLAAVRVQHIVPDKPAMTSGRVEWLLNVMGLKHCADTQVGGLLPGGHCLRGLSGGERKRLAIAVGLMPHIQQAQHGHDDGPSYGLSRPGRGNVLHPLVVLCDEPTSGLDGTCALSVMDLLKQLTASTSTFICADAHQHTNDHCVTVNQQDTVCMEGIIHQPCAVIAAIHQPRPAIWRLLDTVSVLASGKLMYFGPSTNLSSWLYTYAGWMPYFPDLHGSVSDYVLEGVCGGFPASSPQLQQGCSMEHGTQHSSSVNGRQVHCRVTGEVVRNTAQSMSAYLQKHGLFWWFERDEARQMLQSQHASSITHPSVANSTTPTSARKPAGNTAAAAMHNETDKPDRAMPQVEAFTSLPPGQCVTGVPVASPPTTTPPSTYPSLCITQAANQVHITFGPNGHGLISLKSGSFAPHMAELDEHCDPGCSSHHAGSSSAGQPVHRRISKRVQTTLPSATSCTHIDLVADARGSIHIHASMQLVCHDNQPARMSCSTVGRVVEQMAKLLQACWSVVVATAVMVRSVTLEWCAGVQARAGRAARQTALLCWRECIQLCNDPWTTALKVMLSTWSGFTLGLVLYGLDGSVGLAGTQLRAAAMFLNCSIQLCLPYVSLMAYTANAAQARREGETGMCGPMAALLSKLAMTVPVNMACVAAYTLIAYGMQGLRHGVSYMLTHLGLAWLLVLCSAQVMHLSVVACPSVDTAFMITTSWGVLNMYLSGFFVQPGQLQLRWLSPLQYLSAVRLAFQGMLRLELQDARVPCGKTDDWKHLLTMAPPLITIANVQQNATIPLFDRHASVLTGESDAVQDECLLDGNLALQALGVHESRAGVAADAAGLLAYLAGLLLLTCVIQVVKWPRRSQVATTT